MRSLPVSASLAPILLQFLRDKQSAATAARVLLRPSTDCQHQGKTEVKREGREKNGRE